MLETLRIISYIVWIAVGITTIGSMFWGFRMNKRYMRFWTSNIEKKED